MSAVNYLLLYKESSDKGGNGSSVRGFAKLASARRAMVESYRKIAATLKIPVAPAAFNDSHTIKTENSIQLERYGDYFKWEIIQAVPEDGEPNDSAPGAKSNHQPRLTPYTVTIEEHVAQNFSVKAYDIFHAIQYAEKEYKRGSFVVQPSTPNVCLIMAQNDVTGETTEWKNF